jgi:hypothetical protein
MRNTPVSAQQPLRRPQLPTLRLRRQQQTGGGHRTPLARNWIGLAKPPLGLYWMGNCDFPVCYGLAARAPPASLLTARSLYAPE